MKKNGNYFFAAFTILAIALCVVIYNQKQQERHGYDQSMMLGETTFNVEVVSTDADRAHGLSGRAGLCNKCGMLFVFDRPGQYNFWMKDMKFDIDIIWLYEGEIVHIEQNVSHKIPKKIYNTPLVNADQVLELDAGGVQKYDLNIGDHIR